MTCNFGVIDVLCQKIRRDNLIKSAYIFNGVIDNSKIHFWVNNFFKQLRKTTLNYRIKIKTIFGFHVHVSLQETKEVSPTKLWRRISMSVGNSTPLRRLPQSPPDYAMSIKLRTVRICESIFFLNYINACQSFVINEILTLKNYFLYLQFC